MEYLGVGGRVLKLILKKLCETSGDYFLLVLTMVNDNNKEVDTGDTDIHFLQYGMSTKGDEGYFLLMGLDCKKLAYVFVYMLYCIKILIHFWVIYFTVVLI